MPGRRLRCTGDFMLVATADWQRLVAEVERLREVERLHLLERDRSARLAAVRIVPPASKAQTEPLSAG